MLRKVPNKWDVNIETGISEVTDRAAVSMMGMKHCAPNAMLVRHDGAVVSQAEYRRAPSARGMSSPTIHLAAHGHSTAAVTMADPTHHKSWILLTGFQDLASSPAGTWN